VATASIQPQESEDMKAMTQGNMEAAFAGESQAHMKYLNFAEIAEKEGFPEVARLFRATSYAEQVHASTHLRELGGFGDTAANLGKAIGGEHYENTEMYPAFSAVAEAQGEKGALRSIKYALEAEKIHEVLYSQAKAAVEAKKDLSAGAVFVCSVCGHTVTGAAPDKCPVCGAKKEKYRQF
jgi:rubrerythrin